MRILDHAKGISKRIFHSRDLNTFTNILRVLMQRGAFFDGYLKVRCHAHGQLLPLDPLDLLLDQTLAQLAGHGVPGIGALRGGPRLHFMDNLDPDTYGALLAKLPRPLWISSRRIRGCR